MPITPVPCATESAGEIVIPPIEVELNCATDSVTICPGDDPIVVEGTITVQQGASPWVVDGEVALDAATLVALETITVLQGTSPWVVSVDNFPVGGTGLTDAELRATPVPVSGTVTVNEPVTVDGIVTLDVATLIALETITVNQGTSPWVVDGEVALDAATLVALETVTVLQGTSPWVTTVSNFPASQVITAVDLDIRPLDCLTDSVTVCVVDPLPIDDPQANKRFQPGVRTTLATPISALGDNTIVTPAAGMRLRVTWIGMSSPEVGLETLAIVKFGAAGAAKYRWYMGAPGAFSHWEAIEGAANESLIVNLSIGTTVQVNVTFEEF